jgi:hypothetical protein
MDTKALYEETLKKIYSTYMKKRPRSEKLYKEAQSYLPGGDTRSVKGAVSATWMEMSTSTSETTRPPSFMATRIRRW